MDEAGDKGDERLSDPAGWALLDVLLDDSAGKRLLVQCADGSRMQVVEPPEDAQSALAFRERFKAKAAKVRDVTDESLVPTLGFAEDAGKLFLAEPDADGAALADLLRTDGVLEPDAVFEVGLHVARALDALHRRDLVHGWVRPGAILVTSDRALLRDAGLEHPKGETAGVPGPADFMSPEQLSEDRSLRAESDFFSLGSTLFAAIVGRSPFQRETPEATVEAVRTGQAAFPERGEPQLWRNASFLFAKLLALDPADRPQSAAELIADLQAVRRDVPIERTTVEPPPPRKRAAKTRRPSRKVLIAAGVGAAIILLAAVLLFMLGEKPPNDQRPNPEHAIRPTTQPATATSGPAHGGVAREPSSEELAAQALAAADRFAQASPRDADEIIRRFKEVVQKYPGTKPALAAEQKATDYTLKKSAEQLSEFADVQAEADRLAAEKRFGAALAAFSRYETLLTAARGALPADLRDKIERQTGFIRAKAAEAYTHDGDEAAKAIRAERYKDAVGIYESVVALYGIDEYAQRARNELALLRPILAERDKTAATRTAQELEQAYRETAAATQRKVNAFDLESAVADAEKLAKQLAGSALEPNAARHLAHLKRLVALKQRVIEKVNRADPKLKSESLGLRAAASVIESADADGITLSTAAGAQKSPWAGLSEWEKYSIARSVSNVNSGDDLAALGLLSLEQGNTARAMQDLERAQRLGADVADLIERAKKTAAAAQPEDERPARMLVEAKALVAEKKWADALWLLIPLKEKHAVTSYAVREKLGEINAMLAACSAGLARADLSRDIAAGVETALLAAGIDGWDKTGKGWAFKDGRVTCDNAAENDIDLFKPADAAAAYRLSVRCRVLSGNGLMVRVAAAGDDHYDFWLGLGDQGKTGLWESIGGKVGKSALGAVRVAAGEWLEVRSTVTARSVRVECGGQSVVLPSQLKPGGAKPALGFTVRQKSAAEFEDFRIRILREQ